MNKQSFFDLLTRYQEGNCTESEKLWLDQWYGLLGDKNIDNLSSTELDEMKDNVWLKLQNNTQTGKKPRTLKLIWLKTAIAASVIIAFVISGLYVSKNHAESSFMDENSGLDLISKTNTSASPIVVDLNDESKVTLQPNANIIYPKTFAANNRKVYLKGNAFFSITKNPKRPFYVYNNKLVVRVLGTSFFVKESSENLPAEVSVRTGKVQVNENTESSLINLPGSKVAKAVLLTPNQKGLFAEHKIKTTLVEKPIPLAIAYNEPSNISYNFKEESLRAIFKTLSEAYGIEIKSDNEQILDYTFTGDVTNKGLYDQLSLICGSISGKYSISGTRILVSIKN
ncbi:FecR family protein [Pedobacter aquatilis]|uniref:FecR family protein n=1 Tax=Pedobacter aquatilis TaxID=351343 RepID=UPI002931C401|nr:FecR family protein [Pedobacter aquatilis]